MTVKYFNIFRSNSPIDINYCNKCLNIFHQEYYNSFEKALIGFNQITKKTNNKDDYGIYICINNKGWIKVQVINNNCFYYRFLTDKDINYYETKDINLILQHAKEKYFI